MTTAESGAAAFADLGPPSDLAAELEARGLELGPVIGRGAMSIVCRAFDVRHERSLAVKVLNLPRDDRDGHARWQREIGAVARLRHPNIVPLYDSGTTPGGSAYFLMPLAQGETLEIRLRRGPLPMAEAVRYAREVAEALAHAHVEGLVHRDVKPGNILLEGGHAVLADFGLARPIDPEPHESGHQTQVGMVVGTPAYMSPEQLTPGGAVDGRADIFALGIVLYEMLTGRLPFTSLTMPALMADRLTGSFGPVADLRPGVPPLLQRVIARALAPDPENRYDSAESMVADLVLVEHQLSGVGAGLAGMGGTSSWGWAVAGLVAIIAVMMALIPTLRHRPRLDPNRVLVADMRNETADSTAASIGALASDLISAGLATVPGLTVINSSLVFGVPRQGGGRRVQGVPGAELRALVDTTHAATVVSGSYYQEGGRLEVFAEVTDAASGRVLFDLGPLTGPLGRPDSLLARARDSVVAFLRARRSRNG